MPGRLNVLFVCTGNTCRSPMAEHLLRKMAADAGLTGIAVRSAGLAPALELGLPPEAAAALAEHGVSGVRHAPAAVDAALVDWADLILTMEPRHRDLVAGRFPRAAAKTHVLKSHAGIAGPEGIDDPFGGGAEDYRAALADIRSALLALVRNWTP